MKRWQGDVTNFTTWTLGSHTRKPSQPSYHHTGSVYNVKVTWSKLNSWLNGNLPQQWIFAWTLIHWRVKNKVFLDGARTLAVKFRYWYLFSTQNLNWKRKYWHWNSKTQASKNGDIWYFSCLSWCQVCVFCHSLEQVHKNSSCLWTQALQICGRYANVLQTDEDKMQNKSLEYKNQEDGGAQN